jgi:hypothetical protein
VADSAALGLLGQMELDLSGLRAWDLSGLSVTELLVLGALALKALELPSTDLDELCLKGLGAVRLVDFDLLECDLND